MNLRPLKILTVLLTFLGAYATGAYATGYAVDTSGNLFEIEVDSATETLVGPTGITQLIESIASDPSGNLYVTTVANSLYRVDASSGAATLVGTHGGDDIEGLDFRDGALIGVEYTPGAGIPQRLLRLSPVTAAATPLATLDRSDILSISSLAIVDSHTAYFHGVLSLGVGTLFALDIDTGATTVIGNLSTPLAAMDFDGQRLIGLGFGGRVFVIDTASAGMEQIGTTNGQQAWLGVDFPEPRVSILECNGVGSGGNTPTFRHIRFRTDSSFDGVQLRLEATAPGDYFFDAELRRADGITVQAERVVQAAAIGLPGDFAAPPYRPVTIDFGPVAVAGVETFTVSLKNVSGPGGTLVFETFGFGIEPCDGVEEIDTSSPPPFPVIGDPAGFRLLTRPDRRAPLLVCEMPGLMNGDNANSRGVRFTTDRDFLASELRFNATTAGTYTFDVELRRSSGFLATPERVVTGLSVAVPGGLNVQPFRAVAVEFQDVVRVLGAETFTLKMTNVSGPGTLLFETYGIGQTPCPNVQETTENNVATPTERGDPAGYRLLGARELPLPVLWCNSVGGGGFNAAFRGVRFTSPDAFTAIELRMEGAVAGDFNFTAELRRSSGFLVAPERIVPGVSVTVPGNFTSHPYLPVARIELGNVPVAPGTFTLKLADVTGPSSLFFEIDAAPCPTGDVVGTIDNSTAFPAASGSPAGFRLLLLPDSDLDGHSDFVDNCVAAPNPSQLDTDSDGIGNRCDGDFNNDCLTNASDLGLLKVNFFAVGELVTDMNGDGVTNAGDLGLLKTEYFTVPGPAAAPNLCE